MSFADPNGRRVEGGLLGGNREARQAPPPCGEGLGRGLSEKEQAERQRDPSPKTDRKAADLACFDIVSIFVYFS